MISLSLSFPTTDALIAFIRDARGLASFPETQAVIETEKAKAPEPPADGWPTPFP